MNGIDYLADTNAFILLLEKHPSLKRLLSSSWHYSFITQIELLGKFNISTSDIKQVKNLLSICIKLTHSEAINDVAISLKQQYKIKLPDALIAATALHYQLPLLTFDKGFKHIKGLDMIILEM
ncbi:MAG: type II toxin-antitoxin system VapC family toxin [Chryseolinea sp.]